MEIVCPWADEPYELYLSCLWLVNIVIHGIVCMEYMPSYVHVRYLSMLCNVWIKH